jgi:hypothetical protein
MIMKREDQIALVIDDDPTIWFALPGDGHKFSEFLITLN